MKKGSKICAVHRSARGLRGTEATASSRVRSFLPRHSRDQPRLTLRCAVLPVARSP
jgi:hypothetical protein